jgi:cell shape-determining protein MreC
VHREQFGLFQTVEVEPAVDFAHLEEVLVLLREAL